METNSKCTHPQYRCWCLPELLVSFWAGVSGGLLERSRTLDKPKPGLIKRGLAPNQKKFSLATHVGECLCGVGGDVNVFIC